MMMRTKRVTDPLDDKVKALLRGDDCRLMPGYATSGSDHAGPSCFSGLVHAFFEIDCPDAERRDGDSDSDSDSDGGDLRPVDAAEMVRDLLKESESLRGDPFRLRLLSYVRRLTVELAGRRRAVMGRLREMGYNAGLCKARWEACGGLVSGSHEYIDVVIAADGSRYVVDLEFAGQFEIARATEEYGRAVAALPQVMVGRAEEVRQLVRIVCDAARRSLKSRGLHVPPWRKTRYMMAKWLGPYRRTTNALPSSATASAASADVKCRAVGFHATPQIAVIPRAARTR